VPPLHEHSIVRAPVDTSPCGPARRYLQTPSLSEQRPFSRQYCEPSQSSELFATQRPSLKLQSPLTLHARDAWQAWSETATHSSPFLPHQPQVAQTLELSQATFGGSPFSRNFDGCWLPHAPSARTPIKARPNLTAPSLARASGRAK